MTAQQPNRRLRVAYLIGSLEMGGAERQLVRLVNSIDHDRFEPRIYCWFGNGDLGDQVDPRVEVVNLHLQRFNRVGPAHRLLVAARLYWRLVRELRAWRPDVLHAWLVAAYLMAAFATPLAGVRSVIAGRRGLTPYSTYAFPTSLLGRLANRLITVQLCNSEAVRRCAIERDRVDPARTDLIRNGLDLPEPGGAAPLPRGWRGRGPVAAMVANFHGYKGHDVLLDAFARVHAEQPDVRLVLVGDGDQRPAREAQAERLGLGGSVLFAGLRPDAAALMGSFDFTILASFEEGLPNVVMESMAAGVPVVASAVGGCPELISDGEDGLLVPPRDPAALAAAISRMAADPRARARMGEAARARAAREYPVARMVAAHERLYERLAGHVRMPAPGAVD